MASEILAVPEDNLLEVIRVIRAGLEKVGAEVSKDTRDQLLKWCREEEKYIKGDR